MKVFLNIVKVVLYVIGFPLFLALAALNVSKVAAEAPSYGFMAWLGLVVAGVFGLVFLIAVLINTRKKSKKSIKRQMMNLIIWAFCLLAGFGIIVDVVVPPILDDATSGTLFYEDVAYNYQEQSEYNGDLIEQFIRYNIANGNIDPSVAYYELTSNEHAAEALVGDYVTEVQMTAYTNADSDGGYYDTYGDFYMPTSIGYPEEDLDDIISKLDETDKALYDFILDQYVNYDIRYSVMRAINTDKEWVYDANPQAGAFKKALTLQILEKMGPVNKAAQAEGVNYKVSEELTKLMKETYNKDIVTVLDLLLNNFQAMDKDGYTTLDTHCLIGYAQMDGRMTVPVIVHLLLDERPIKSDGNTNFNYILYNPGTDSYDVGVSKWTVLDMDGKPMQLDLTSLLGGLMNEEGNIDLSALMAGVTLSVDDMFAGNLLGLDSAVYPVVGSLNELVAAEELAGTTLELFLQYLPDEGTIILQIRPNNVARGVLGYQWMAWLNSGSLLFGIITVFSIRQLCFIFAGVCVISLYLIGLIREKLAEIECSDECCECDACDSETEAADEVVADEEAPSVEDELIVEGE